VTSHHPVEWAYVWWAKRHGRTPPPANRAPRRFACLLGALSFFSASGGLLLGAAGLFWFSALLLVVLPLFVAVTNICVPSALFTVLFGADRATRGSLQEALDFTRRSATESRGLLSTPV
jgi:hypothetical protein